MDAEQKKTLVASIAKFLEDELKEHAESSENPDFVEGIEVAVQCIKSSFDLSSIDYDCVPRLGAVFTAGCQALNVSGSAQKRAISEEDKAKAEQLKAEGNSLISEGKFADAVAAYSSAIDLDPYSPVYYGNRAAAQSKLGRHEEAIADCERALRNDPAYSKAYGRMGFAYASLKDHARAVECYERALALEPDNASYRQNLETARGALPGDQAQRPGGFDFMSLLNNPQMMSMASQMMQSPQVQHMIASMMGGMPADPQQPQQPQQQQQPQDEAAEAGQQMPANVPDMQELLRMGQQFASQMQAANPDLVASLRQEFQSGVTIDEAGEPGSEQQEKRPEPEA